MLLTIFQPVSQVACECLILFCSSIIPMWYTSLHLYLQCVMGIWFNCLQVLSKLILVTLFWWLAVQIVWQENFDDHSCHVFHKQMKICENIIQIIAGCGWKPLLCKWPLPANHKILIHEEKILFLCKTFGPQIFSLYCSMS